MEWCRRTFPIGFVAVAEQMDAMVLGKDETYAIFDMIGVLIA